MPETPEIEPRRCRRRSRRCLMCGEGFPSLGPHNRICPKCKMSQTWREGDTTCTAHDGKLRR